MVMGGVPLQVPGPTLKVSSTLGVPEMFDPDAREIGLPTCERDRLNLMVVPAELVADTRTERNFPASA